MTIANRLTGSGIGRASAMIKAWVLVKMPLVETKVAGVTQGNRQRAIEHLTRYDREQISIHLARERDNRHDRNAVAVIATVEGKGSYRMGYIPRPLAGMIAPLMEAGKAVQGLFKGVHGGTDHLFHGMATLFTSMRESEVLGLAWDCVDFERGTILVRQQLIRSKAPGVGYNLQTLKNDKPCTVTPAPAVMERLQSHRTQQAQQRLRAGGAWRNEWGLVFANALGEHLRHINVYKHYKSIVAPLGLPSLRFHDLRHSYAVNALQAGDDIKTVQENLGHHAASFTLDTYMYVTDQMRRDSAGRMEAFIKAHAK